MNEFEKLIKPIISNKEFKKRKHYLHHDDSVYEHSLNVATKTYQWSKRLGLDWKSATIGALLHDFYLECWQTNKKKGKVWEAHGFTHAGEAAVNAKRHFPELINKKVENIIKRHMFPLTITPPFYLESWLVTIIDKLVSLKILTKPKDWPKYLGLRRNKK